MDEPVRRPSPRVATASICRSIDGFFAAGYFAIAFTTGAFAVGVDGAATSSSIAVVLIDGAGLIRNALPALN